MQKIRNEKESSMIRPLQTTSFPRIGSQQANTVALQSTVLPAQAGTSLDMSSLMSMMIQMMIVVMMMKMMTGAMKQVA
jgi:hypothetical protein